MEVPATPEYAALFEKMVAQGLGAGKSERQKRIMTTTNIFEQIKRLDDDGREYWSSRELAAALGYTDYRNFENVIANAKEACQNNFQTESDHFVEVTEMVKLGSGAEREVKVIYLSRYACYLIVQSADPRKEAVALGILKKLDKGD